jgi:hypothetical protein
MGVPVERRTFLASALLGLPAALLPLAGAAPLAGRRLNRAEQEEFLLKAEITKTHDVSEGITNTRRATLTDGVITHDAQIQTIDQRKTSFTDARGTYLHFADSFKHNIAAYELDKIMDMGMIPPSVERVVRGQTSSMTWWVDDVQMTEKQRYQKKITPPDQAAWNRQIYCVRTFDELIYNFDRNLGNLVITKQWRIWMIDHTRAFLPYQKLNDAKRLVQCDRHLLAAMRGLTLEKVQKGLDRYLDSLRIQGLMAGETPSLRISSSRSNNAGKSRFSTTVCLLKRSSKRLSRTQPSPSAAAAGLAPHEDHSTVAETGFTPCWSAAMTPVSREGAGSSDAACFR